MTQSIIILEILMEIFEELNQKLIATISIVLLMMSGNLNKLHPKYINEGVIDVEQILCGKSTTAGTTNYRPRQRIKKGCFII